MRTTRSLTVVSDGAGTAQPPWMQTPNLDACPPPFEQNDTQVKNITFPQTSFAGGNEWN